MIFMTGGDRGDFMPTAITFDQPHAIEPHSYESLNQHQKMLVTADNQVTGVTVTAPAPGGGGDGSVGTGGGGGSEGGDSGGSAGGGGSPPPPPPPPPPNSHACDDASAAQLALIIKGQNYHVQEYDADIYRDQAGNIHLTSAYPGAMDVSGQANGASANVPPGSYLIGFIHNHPGDSSGLPSNSTNASGGGPGDYEAFKTYAAYDDQYFAARGGSANLNMYIIADDGTIYDYNNANIDATLTGHAGNIIPPNATCPSGG